MNQEKDARRMLVTRRQFLQGVVMGVAAANLLPPAGAIASSPQEDFEIVNGILVAKGDGWLDIQVQNESKRLYVHNGTSFWKGGERTDLALSKGDDIMVRAHSATNRALRVWSNLDRIAGVVVQTKETSFLLQVGGVHGPTSEILLQLDEQTLIGNLLTYSLDGATPLISVGDSIDAIGERLAEGHLRATLAYLYRTSDAQGSSNSNMIHQGPDRREINNLNCSYSYNGYAGWFNCSTGAGRCGTCNTSRGDQAAWPAMDSCGCCNYSCCDCSRNCKNQVYLSCGKDVSVTDLCQNRTRTVYIADCGPCQKPNCSGCSPDLCARSCNDCRGHVTAVIDLTRPTFAAFGYDPALRGCFSTTVTVTFAPPCPLSSED